MFMYLSLDFNEDDYICENDLKKMITKLCGEQRLTEESIQNVIDKVCVGDMAVLMSLLHYWHYYWRI